jgi:serine protease AprX
LLRYQTTRMQSDSFATHHLDGSGIRIAVFDVGFPDVDKHPAFAHLRSNHQIKATYNFVKKTENVYTGHWHGTATLSCIGGRIDSINIGMATGAEFYLAKTERLLSENYSEEENWLAAAEWADKNGVNIISSSLGYTFRRYFNTEMNGKSSLISRAATIAASKGILVVNAAGNDGSDDWRIVNAPADADSVLTVGGTDPSTDSHIYFSSYGPTSDGRLKPNVCAVGEAIVAKPGGLSEKSGTSFSAPLVAGFAACAWQSHRQWSNMELFDEIEKSASLYPYFDYAHGFGIPQASYFISEKQMPEPTFDFVIINNDIKVILREQYSYPGEEAALGYNAQRNFYYKIEDKNGAIKKYVVLVANKKEMLHFYAEDFKAGDVLSIHFEGYTGEMDFPEQEK